MNYSPACQPTAPPEHATPTDIAYVADWLERALRHKANYSGTAAYSGVVSDAADECLLDGRLDRIAIMMSPDALDERARHMRDNALFLDRCLARQRDAMEHAA